MRRANFYFDRISNGNSNNFTTSNLLKLDYKRQRNPHDYLPIWIFGVFLFIGSSSSSSHVDNLHKMNSFSVSSYFPN